jgi:HEAT repeat protein
MPERRRCGDALVAAKAEALPHLDVARRNPDPRVRLEVVFLLQRLRDLGAPWLLEAAEDPAPEVAKVALNALGAVEIPADQAIPVLGRVARGPDNELRAAALGALRRYGAAALPVLRDAVADPDPRRRASAMPILGAFGAAALDLLVAALADKDASVRVAGATALRQLKDAALPALPALGALLDDAQAAASPSTACRLAAAGGLARRVIVADAIRRIRGG